LAGLLNSQPMGFYAPGQLVRDAREHGIEVREPDINFSGWDSSLEAAPFNPKKMARRHLEMKDVIRAKHAVRLGLRQIKGLNEETAEILVQKRGSGYTSVR